MSEPSVFRSLWYRWKSLRLPWRKTWLCGYDLAGNTFWEFRSQLATRPRRIAKYPWRTHHGDVRLTPAWIQWLRHTRPNAPTLDEQALEVERQEKMLQLAAAADQRWNEKESFLDRPQDTGQAAPLLQPRDAAGYAPDSDGVQDSKRGVRSAVGDQQEVRESVDAEEGQGSPGEQSQSREGAKEREPNPWKTNRGAPSEGWQPQAWTPTQAERR